MHPRCSGESECGKYIVKQDWVAFKSQPFPIDVKLRLKWIWIFCDSRGDKAVVTHTDKT